MTTLHIRTSARDENSNSRAIGQNLIDALAQPVVTRDLAKHPLPAISAADLMDAHMSINHERASLQAYQALSETLIDELRQADTLVIEAPIYNFGVPVVLKQWIDAVCRAGVSFRYTEKGPEGLLNIKHAYLVVTSGGTPVGGAMDFVSGYLQHICRFIGVESVEIIDGSGSKGEPEKIIAHANQQIANLLIEESQIA